MLFTHLLTLNGFIVEVGTRLYIAPEILSHSRKGPRNHTKADIYSLGVGSVQYKVCDCFSDCQMHRSYSSR